MYIETLTDAINRRKSIRYQYSSNGENLGTRIGHPYAIFMYTSIEEIVTTKVHIVQISGASKSAKAFPSFRQHNIEDFLEITILEEDPSFDEPFHKDYKPESVLYINVIAKI